MASESKAEIRRSAELSECGRYRYRLTREWDAGLPKMVFVMLNPSTADGAEDDPTIRRCMGFARREQCGGIIVVNVFPWRATKPAGLVTAYEAGEAVHGESDVMSTLDFNASHIVEALGQSNDGPVVAAWGAHGLAATWWPGLGLPADLLCLGTTKSGAPRHPLYVKGDTPLQDWKGYRHGR